MKTIITIVCCLVMCCSMGQEKKKNIFGLIAGTNVSTLSDYEGDPMLGLTAGVYWEWNFAQKFALQSNFLYLQKGESGNGSVTSIKLGYIYMPMMLKYYINDQLAVMTGINSDFLISASGNQIDKDDFKSTYWGIPIAASYDISNRFQLGATINLGLSSIPDSDNAPNIKNNFGLISVTYLFRK